MKRLVALLLLTGCDKVASLDYYHDNENPPPPPIVTKFRPSPRALSPQATPEQPPPVTEVAPPLPEPIVIREAPINEPPPPPPTESIPNAPAERQQKGHATSAVKPQSEPGASRWWHQLFPWWDKAFPTNK